MRALATYPAAKRPSSIAAWACAEYSTSSFTFRYPRQVSIRQMTVCPILNRQLLNNTMRYTKSTSAHLHLVHSSSTQAERRKGHNCSFKSRDVFFLKMVVMKHYGCQDHVDKVFRIKALKFICLLTGIMNKVQHFAQLSLLHTAQKMEHGICRYKLIITLQLDNN